MLYLHHVKLHTVTKVSYNQPKYCSSKLLKELTLFLIPNSINYYFIHL